jgi:hypothetical protein
LRYRTRSFSLVAWWLLITVMITAVVTRDLALLERATGGGPIAFVGCELGRPFSRGAAGFFDA